MMKQSCWAPPSTGICTVRTWSNRILELLRLDYLETMAMIFGYVDILIFDFVLCWNMEPCNWLEKMATWTYLWGYCWSMFQSNGLQGLGRFLKAFLPAMNTRALNKRAYGFLFFNRGFNLTPQTHKDYYIPSYLLDSCVISGNKLP